MSLQLIAHFLQSKGLHQTLETLEKECGTVLLPSLLCGESLEEILADRVAFSKLSLEEPVTDPTLIPWLSPYPKKPTTIEKIPGLVVSSATDGKNVYLSTNDGRLHTVDAATKTVQSRAGLLGRVIIKKVLVLGSSLLLVGMDGMGHIYDLQEGTITASGRLHDKLVVDVKYIQHNGTSYLVSISRDMTLKVFGPDLGCVGSYELGQLPTAFDVATIHNRLVAVVGKVSHTLLDVIALEGKPELMYRLSINDAEFSPSGFSPMSISIRGILTKDTSNTKEDTSKEDTSKEDTLQNKEDTSKEDTLQNKEETSEKDQTEGLPLVCVGTSHEPYMRLIVVRLPNASGVVRNQIVLNIPTSAPQDKLSQPIVAWRVDGSGVWVMGEDGMVRGVDLAAQKSVVEIRGHEGRIKEFCQGDGFIVTGGVDRRVTFYE